MIWFEDMPVGRIDRYGTTEVTREAVLDFARQYDPQPFHLDDEAAIANPLFGRLAASGWHTAVLGMRMTVDYWDALGGRAMLAGAGIDELRWLKPVFPGDRLHCESEVMSARASATKPDRGIIGSRLTIFNQQDEPVMSQLANVLMLRRQPSAQ
ncbi:MAG: MaoC family dehydratase [Sphingomonas sp.]|nr:MaoC family dehydratase [Sphingomonas sp.]